MTLPKTNILGVGVTHCTYASATEEIIALAHAWLGGLVTASAVHLIMEARKDATLRCALNEFDLISPDGQPVRWGLNWLGDADLPERVYGPDLMLTLCAQAAEETVGIYLYGSSDSVLAALREHLTERFPTLKIVGSQPSRFRADTPEEMAADAAAIRDSEAGIVFVGLGCPRQEWWAFQHRRDIRAVQVCVGAAFDFHAGTIRQAPPTMQRFGLEWLFRVWVEPRRLWRRYLWNNPLYLWLIFLQWCGLRQFPRLHADENEM